MENRLETIGIVGIIFRDYREYIGAILGNGKLNGNYTDCTDYKKVYLGIIGNIQGYMGIKENNMETTI